MSLILWVGGLLGGLLGGMFVWSALYPLLGGTRDEATFLGLDFVGLPTTFNAGVALVLAMGLAFVGFAVYLLWLSREGSDRRVIADRDGIALRTRGRSRYTWAQIDHFEVATLLDEGLVHLDAVDGRCAVMVLRSGERVPIHALRTWAPFGSHGSGDVATRVHTLNTMHLRRRGA